MKSLDLHEKPLEDSQIVFWDEHHRKQILGPASKYEFQLCKDENGVFNENGTWSAEHPVMTAKYLEEVRGLFGPAAVDREGVREGRKSSKIFWYTGRLVIGPKQYKEKGAAELQRVLALKGGRCRNGGWGEINDGYPEKYGDGWETELKKRVDTKWCNVTELIDFLFSESKEMMKGTKHEHDFVIDHDAMSAWKSDEAMQYMKDKGIYKHLLMF